MHMLSKNTFLLCLDSRVLMSSCQNQMIGIIVLLSLLVSLLINPFIYLTFKEREFNQVYQEKVIYVLFIKAIIIPFIIQIIIL